MNSPFGRRGERSARPSAAPAESPPILMVDARSRLWDAGPYKCTRRGTGSLPRSIGVPPVIDTAKMAVARFGCGPADLRLRASAVKNPG